ncbi:hypothetical protein [Butyrivibrio sp. MB2005]|uniref:hypothetical protein n=1 Tax=Butyrivibrio sp. MB2005 TaxID=1280678 RepID=UPI00047D132F|nr:hypothetical protein [Butyrivibrio sp. MB2005]
MISRVEHISEKQLEKIRILVGEAFVTNDFFHNWGSIDERREDVMKYMALYVGSKFLFNKCGRRGARRPGDVGFAPTVARGPVDLCLATTETECRSEAEIEPRVQCSLPLRNTKDGQLYADHLLYYSAEEGT